MTRSYCHSMSFRHGRAAPTRHRAPRRLPSGLTRLARGPKGGVRERSGITRLLESECRLPTEAEWEYSCRAGSTGKYSFGDDTGDLAKYAWYGSNAGRTTHPVDSKPANAFGLYGMDGNVAEWCLDWHNREYYSQSEEEDPRGPETRTVSYGLDFGRSSRGGSLHIRRVGLPCCSPWCEFASLLVRQYRISHRRISGAWAASRVSACLRV
jgi:formylglycine-generating enzyme required for sulfatase activity